jgi:dTDP-4-dehydrorhamnose reductase
MRSFASGEAPAEQGRIGSIVAVVLTYNRRDLLRGCLAAVEQQTHRPHQVIVVDNASSDGTSAMLQREFPGVEVARIRNNAGAAGGFNVGMRLAVAAGADYVWVMDDDVIAERDTVARLVQALSITRADGRDPPFVISTARDPGGYLTNVPVLDDARNRLSYSNWPVYLHEAMAPVRSATFVSILIPSQVFERHGFPLSSMFIWGEDFEFTERITKQEPGFICGLSRVQHIRATAGNLDIRTEADPVRLKWHRLFVRNRIYRLRRYGTKREFVRHLASASGSALKLLLEGEFNRARLTASGLVAGLRFRPRPDPAVDKALLEYVTPGLQGCLDGALEQPMIGPSDNFRKMVLSQ